MSKTFKTLAEFKRVLQPGDKMHTINHMKTIGRDEHTNKVIYGDYVYPVREVSIKKTNMFALKTENNDLKTGIPNGTYCDSWLEFPAASMCKIEDNKLIILKRDTRQFTGGMMDISNPEYRALPLIPTLTYWFAE